MKPHMKKIVVTTPSATRGLAVLVLMGAPNGRCTARKRRASFTHFRGRPAGTLVMLSARRLQRPILVLLMFVLAGACATAGAAESGAIANVNPLIGTGGDGHTFPGATVPFGMIQLSPDPAMPDFHHAYKWAAGYRYDDHSILGFSHTHF